MAWLQGRPYQHHGFAVVLFRVKLLRNRDARGEERLVDDQRLRLGRETRGGYSDPGGERQATVIANSTCRPIGLPERRGQLPGKFARGGVSIAGFDGHDVAAMDSQDISDGMPLPNREITHRQFRPKALRLLPAGGERRLDGGPGGGGR